LKILRPDPWRFVNPSVDFGLEEKEPPPDTPEWNPPPVDKIPDRPRRSREIGTAITRCHPLLCNGKAWHNRHPQEKEKPKPPFLWRRDPGWLAVALALLLANRVPYLLRRSRPLEDLTSRYSKSSR